jgi:excinuclease ABC subunit C
MTDINKIKEELKNIERKVGVYLFKDAKNKVIYVGKACDLGKRIQQHFSQKKSNRKDKLLVDKVKNIDYILTNSDVEALILEANLIKIHKPKYNIRLRDDKAYPYIKITTDEDYPKLLVVRSIKDNCLYFGPYADTKSLKRTLRLIKQIFPIRTCKDKLKPFGLKTKKRPCLNFYINRCLAPCQGNVKKEDYRNLITRLIEFLNGDYQRVVSGLHKQMKEAASCLNFEQAGLIRDKLRAVERIMLTQRVIVDKPIDWDVINFQEGENIIIFLILQVRKGRLIEKQEFIIQKNKNLNYAKLDILSSFVKQFYIRRLSSFPEEIILPFDVEDRKTLEKFLREKKKKNIKILIPTETSTDAKNLRIMDNLLSFAKENAKILLAQKEPTTTEYQDVLYSLKVKLKLDKLPLIIEGYDISCISNVLACGACVVFHQGLPNKKEYRRFKIKNQNAQTDIYFLEEVIKRRFLRLIKEKKRLPDLVVVDGGRLQLNKAYEVLLSLGLDKIPVVAIAKGNNNNNDKIFKINCKKALSLPTDSKPLHLLQKIRDEAHRFSHQYHLILRKRNIHKI